jgi:hypothetical protein
MRDARGRETQWPFAPPGRRFVAFWRAKPNPEILKERINEARENKILLAE